MGNELRDCRGSVLMETVIVMPVLLLLIFGVIQFAHIWTARQMVAYAAFCATRAIMVVPDKSEEKDIAAQKAAEIALSWINLVDDPDHRTAEDVSYENCVDIPGWGRIPGSGFSRDNGLISRCVDPGHPKRVHAKVNCKGEGEEVASVTVRFRFPLVFNAMGINRIIAGAFDEPVPSDALHDPNGGTDLYHEMNARASRAVARMQDGWPYIELTETCVLPMPYSTARFPTGAFEGMDIRRASR